MTFIGKWSEGVRAWKAWNEISFGKFPFSYFWASGVMVR